MQGKVEVWKTGVSWFVVRDHGRFVERSQLFYRYTYAVMFSVHGKYYSVVGQVWCADPGDKSVLQRAVEAEVKRVAMGYDPAEWGGLVVTANSDWEPVPIERGVRLDAVDVRVEFKGKRTWKRLKSR